MARKTGLGVQNELPDLRKVPLEVLMFTASLTTQSPRPAQDVNADVTTFEPQYTEMTSRLLKISTRYAIVDPTSELCVTVNDYNLLTVQIILKYEMHEGCQKNRLSRPTSQLANRVSLYTTHSQSTGENHRFVIFSSVHSINHHSSVVFRHDESVDHHSDDSIVPFRHDTSVAGHNVALNRKESLTEKLSRTEELSGSLSRKFTNTANPSCSSYASIYNSRLVSIERAKQDKPSATSIALNNGGNRRQSNGEGFGCILLNVLVALRGPRLLSGTSSGPTSTSPRRHL
ncbi:hypothetical protein F511_40281 [Dorcoceras hygrometricum]|uniref:Uncharacterized protein n=1 Tax=Dorcoceras hygrometricum TaxID=472368 RepID=A0A2Z7BQ00_9LAMI|nr:hypothetical protein F511_40281 [Dorcoceras hygrometricum]